MSLRDHWREEFSPVGKFRGLGAAPKVHKQDDQYQLERQARHNDT